VKGSMKFTKDRPFSDLDKAARKLVEIANTVEAVQDGRIHIELINLPFLRVGGSADEYGAALIRPSPMVGLRSIDPGSM
jgi:hypothetical protein